MVHTDRIREAFARNEEALSREPDSGIASGRVTVRLQDGLACEISGGPWKISTDMPEYAGGGHTAPTPGFLEAGALGSCIAVMIGLWAARLGVAIDRVGVDVEFESDRRVLFGVGDVPSRWRSVKYIVTVESTAPEAEVRRVLDLAHQYSHVRGDMEHAFTISRETRITAPAV